MNPSDRSVLVRLASALPSGSTEKKALQSLLASSRESSLIPPRFWNVDTNYNLSEDLPGGASVIKAKLGPGTYMLARKEGEDAMARALLKMGFKPTGEKFEIPGEESDPETLLIFWADESGAKVVSWVNEMDDESYAVGVKL